MPSSTVSLLEQMLTGGLQNKKILILGASYREDVDDTRHSPSTILAKQFLEKAQRSSLPTPWSKASKTWEYRCTPSYLLRMDSMPWSLRSGISNIASWISENGRGQERPVVLDFNGVLGRPALGGAGGTADFKVAAIGRGVV